MCEECGDFSVPRDDGFGCVVKACDYNKYTTKIGECA